MTSIKPIADQVVVITGASSCLGKGITLRLANEKATLILAARNHKRLQALAQM